jgi:hypothetical protein
MATIKNSELTCTSWLSGKLSDKIEINTKLPYVSIYDYFVQGELADSVINEINLIYNSLDCTPLEAAEKWYSNNF